MTRMSLKSPTEKILRDYASTEGIFRASSLTANIVMTSVVAQVAGFGSDGVLVSAFVHLSLAALLEVPTGLVADSFGAKRSIVVGLSLKIITTIAFLVAAFFALKGSPSLAISALAVESIIDAFASSLVSGSFQAAYLKWYSKKLEEAGIPEKEAPPLFLSSYQHALKVRLGVPLLFVAIVACIMSLAKVQTYVVLLPIVALIFLRLWIVLKVVKDLSIILSRQQDGSASKRGREHAKEILKSCYETMKGDGRLVFLINALGSFLYLTSSMFLIGKAIQAIGNLGITTSLAWGIGAAIGLISHLIVIMAGKALYPKLAQAKVKTFEKMGVLIALIGLVLAVSELAPTASYVKTIAVAAAAISLMLVSGGIQKWAESQSSKFISSDSLATWFSLVETASLAVFGLIAGLTLASGYEPISVVIYAIGIFFAGVFIFAFFGSTEAHTVSLNRFLTFRIVAVATVICLIGFIVEVRGTYQSLKDSALERERAYANLALASLKEPLIQGAFIETKRRMEMLLKETQAACISIEAEGFPSEQCASVNKEEAIVAYHSDVRFDDSSPAIFAKIHLFFDRSKIDATIRNKILMAFLGYLLVASFSIILLKTMSKRIVKEFESLQETSSLGPEIKISKRKFLLSEAESIAHRLNKALMDRMEAEKNLAVLRATQMVAHDMRQPFTALKMGLSIIAAEIDNPEKLRTSVRMIEENVNKGIAKAENILQEMMHAGKPSNLERSHMKLADAVGSIVDIVRSCRAAQGIEFDVNIPTDVCLYGDAAKLTRVFQNILENAIQAQPGSGKIWIELSKDQTPKTINLIFGNTESFIPEDAREILFEPFYTKGKRNGTGLGLAASRQIMESHFGRIRCESDKEEGTRFVLEFPREAFHFLA